MAAAYCRAMAHRICALLIQLGVQEDFAITGGVCKNVGIVKRVGDELGTKVIQPKREIDPQVAGALGAALFAQKLARQGIPG